MTSAYYTQQDHDDLTTRVPQDCPLLLDKCAELVRAVSRRMRDLSWDLHTYWERPGIITGRSAAATNAIYGISMPFLRSREQALLVERMMGRDGVSAPASVDWHHHPVIELRLTPENFAIELILPPSAWWDQRNLVGKLSVARHRETLRSLLARMDGDFRFGFWDGIHLSDLHLTSMQLVRSGALYELMNTFGDGQDWMRVGVWYEPEDERLTTGQITVEVVNRMAALYPLYNFFLWTSNNNFQSFHPANAWMYNSRDMQQ